MSSPADTGAAPTTSHRQHYRWTFVALTLAGLAYALLQSLVAPALPEIQRSLGASTTSAAWILTAYLISASVLTPVIGRLGDMYGKDRLLLITLAMLSAGTALAAMASSIEVLLVARAIQGAGGGIFPLAFGIIRDEFPRERVPSGIALMSAILGIGGGLGIVLAGPIVEATNYHWLFWFPLIMVLVATAGAAFFVPRSPVRVPGKVSWAGVALLSGWLVCVLVSVSEGSHWGWGSAQTIGLFAVGVGLFLAWVAVESRSDEPLIDMDMMRIRGVWTVNAAALLIGAGMITSFILFPQFVEASPATGYGFDASVGEAGLFLLPCTAMVLFMGPVAGRLTVRFGARLPLILGALFSSASYLFLAALHDDEWNIYVSSGLLGIGIGLAFSSLINLIVEAVRPDQTGAATGMNTVMRTIGGALGGTVAASILAGSVVAGTGLPSERGFTVAFVVTGVLCAGGAVASLLVPRRAVAPAVAVMA